MAQGSWIEKVLYRRSLAHWSDAADAVPTTEISRLKALRKRAWNLRTHLDRVIVQTETRLRPAPVIAKPLGADWIWRPGLFVEAQRSGFVSSDRSSICQDVTLFHDCALAELGVQQVPNRDPQSETPFALQLDVFDFRGSFLSMAIDVPAEAVQGLRRKHLIRVEVENEAERAMRMFVRLNVQHGPNTEQLLAEVDDGGVAEFDLAYSNLNEDRAEKMWVDLILENPKMNRIVLKDFRMIRRPRAEI